MLYEITYNTSFAAMLGVSSIEDFNKEHNVNLDFGGFVPTITKWIEIPDYIENPTPENISFYAGLDEVPDGLIYHKDYFSEKS